MEKIKKNNIIYISFNYVKFVKSIYMVKNWISKMCKMAYNTIH